MNDRPDAFSADAASPHQAIVTPVSDGTHDALASVLASPEALTLIGGLTERFRSLGVRPPRYQQELETCVAGRSSVSRSCKARHLLFSVAHQTAMEMLIAEGRERFNRSKDVAEISGIALLDREGARGGGTDRLWFLLQTLSGHLAALCLDAKKDCRVELRHAKALNWLPDGAKGGSVLTATCFRVRYTGLTRRELDQMIGDAMAEISELNRAERLSLHRCYHA